MSNSVSALLIKFVLTFGAGWIAFNLLDNNPTKMIFLTAAFAATANYLVSDMIILPSRSNVLATAFDAVLTFIAAYIVSILAPSFNPSVLSLFVFAIIVATIEYFFHSILLSNNDIEPKN